jgi:hypothetical protein
VALNPDLSKRESRPLLTSVSLPTPRSANVDQTWTGDTAGSNRGRGLGRDVRNPSRRRCTLIVLIGLLLAQNSGVALSFQWFSVDGPLDSGRHLLPELACHQISAAGTPAWLPYATC